MSSDTKHNIFALLDTMSGETCFDLMFGNGYSVGCAWPCRYIQARSNAYVDWWQDHRHVVKLKGDNEPEV